MPSLTKEQVRYVVDSCELEDVSDRRISALTEALNREFGAACVQRTDCLPSAPLTMTDVKLAYVNAFPNGVSRFWQDDDCAAMARELNRRTLHRGRSGA